MKPVSFLGDSLARLRVFPRAMRRAAGFQLDKVQRGLDPDDWKPMKAVGRGVREIRVQDETGAFRVLYATTFPEAVYVLHTIRKTTERTARPDLQLARARFKDLVKGRR